jgi:hypothetical protein
MIRQVDKRDGYIIQKVVKPNGKVVAYQIMPVGMINGDATHIRAFATLQAAREAIGK